MFSAYITPIMKDHRRETIIWPIINTPNKFNHWYFIQNILSFSAIYPKDVLVEINQTINNFMAIQQIISSSSIIALKM